MKERTQRIWLAILMVIVVAILIALNGFLVWFLLPYP